MAISVRLIIKMISQKALTFAIIDLIGPKKIDENTEQAANIDVFHSNQNKSFNIRPKNKFDNNQNIQKATTKYNHVEQMITNIDSSFAIKDTIINKIIDIKNNSHYLAEATNYILRCTVFDFNQQEAFLKNEGNIFRVLNCIISILSMGSKNLPKNQNLLISTFYCLYLKYIKISSKNEFEQFSKIITNFFSVLFSLNCDFSPNLYDLLESTALRFINPNSDHLDNLANDFICFIDSIIIKNKPNFPSNCAQTILQMICGSITGLDLTAILYFSTVSAIIDNETISVFTELCISTMISETIQPNNNELKFENDNDEDESSHNKSYLIDENNYYLYSLIKPKVLIPKLKLIINIIKQNEEVCNRLLRSSTKMFKNYESFTLSSFALEIIFLETVSNTSSEHGIVSLFSNQILFNNEKFSNLFNSNDSLAPATTAIRDFLRQKTVEIILNEGISTIQAQLDSITSQPVVFLEVVNIMINMISEILKMEKEDLATLCLTFIHLLQNHKNNQNEYELIHSNVLCLLTSIINFCPDFLFNHCFFTEVFLTLLNDSNSIDFVLSLIISHVSLINENFVNTFIRIFLDINDFSSVSKIINVFNQILSINKTFFRTPDIISKICGSLTKMKMDDNDSINKILIVNSISFFFLSHYMIKNIEISALMKAIDIAYNNKTDYNLLSKLVQLLAGRNLPSLHPSFIISQPKILSVIFSSFAFSEIFKESFEILKGLLLYSKENSKLAHLYGFDGFLLDWIASNPTSSAKKEAIFLFEIIAKSFSSYSLVLHFISMLKITNKDKTFCSYHYDILQALCNLLSPTNLNLNNSLPLDSKYFFDIISANSTPTLSHNTFGTKNNSFTLVFNIFPTSVDTQYRPQILSLKTSNSSSLSIVLFGINILIFISSPGFSDYILRPDFHLPLNEWSFISLSFSSEYKRISPIANGQYTNDILINTITYMPYSFNNFRIGGTTSESIQITNPMHLDLVGMFPLLDIHQIAEIRETKGAFASKLNPIFFFTTIRAGDNIVLNNHSPQNAKILNSNMFSLPINSNFEDIFIAKSFNLVLPLFDQWDLKKENGDKMNRIIDFSLEILQSSLSYSPSVQEIILSNKSFSIISYLMMKSNDSNISYNLYLLFFNLTSSISSKELLKHLFSEILLNIELWMKSDSSNLERILKHWARVLFPTNFDVLKELISFETILEYLRSYFWYVQLDDNEYTCFCCDSNARMTSTLNIKQCRSYLLQIALSFLQSRNIDVRPLLSHIIKNNDHLQLYDLLDFLIKVLQIKNAQFQGIQALNSIIWKCNGVDERIFLSSVNIVLLCHAKNLFQQSIDENVQIILKELNHSLITESMLFQIIPLTDKNHSLFPLCSLMAMILGENIIKVLYTTLQPHIDYVSNQMKMKYALKSMLKVSSSTLSVIIHFLLDCSLDSMIFQYAIIKSNIDITKSLLFEMGNIILYRNDISCSGNNIGHYFRIIRQYLFFHDNKINVNNMNFSVFNDKNSDIVGGSDHFEHVFSYRINTNCQWEDEDIACQAIKIFNIYHYSEYYSTILLIFSVLSRFRDIDLNVIKSFDMSNSIYDDYLNLIQLNCNKREKKVSNNNIFQKSRFANEFIAEISDSYDIELLELSQKLFVENETYNKYIDDLSNKIMSSKPYANTSHSNLLNKRFQNKLLWDSFWKQVSKHLAPYSNGEQINCPLKIDSTLDQFCYCPIKIIEIDICHKEERNNLDIYNISKDLLSNTLLNIPCRLMKLNSSRPKDYNFVLLKDSSFIIYNENKQSKIFHKDEIGFIFNRMTNSNKQTSLEFYLKDGKSLLIDLIQYQSMPIVRYFNIINLPISYYTDQWVNRKLSTFNYINYINLYGGRSINNIKQYPIFPKFIYSDKYDLNNELLNVPFSEILKSVTPEIIPEFFYMFDLFIMNNQLGNSPSQNKDIVEEIYQNRKELESENTSDSLSLWIDSVWGVGSKKVTEEERIYPKPIFFIHHPKRNRKIVNINLKQPRIIAIQSPLSSIFGASISFKQNKMKVKILDCNIKNMLDLTFNFKKKRSSYDNQLSLLKDKSTDNASLKPTKCISKFISKESLNCFNHFDSIYTFRNNFKINEGSSLFITNTEKNKIFQLNNTSFSFDHIFHSNSTLVQLCCADQWLVIVDSDSIVYLTYLHSNNNIELKSRIETYCTSITCCAVETKLSTLVCGTECGNLLLISLNKGIITKCIDLDNWIPTNVTVSHSLGFIVVFSNKIVDGKLNKKFSLFTINGTLIKEKEVHFNVSILKTFTDYNGFDFIYSINETGRMNVFEAFYLDNVENYNKYDLQEPVSVAEYCITENSIVAISKTGKVIFVPHIIC